MHGTLSLVEVVVGSLATWRVTHLLWGEDGPWGTLVWLRGFAPERSFLDCFYCLSVAVAIPFACAIAASWLERAVTWLALSGAAILLERATLPSAAVPPATVLHQDLSSPID